MGVPTHKYKPLRAERECNIMAKTITKTFNGKSKKHEILDYIIEAAKQVKDKNLIARINYSLRKANEDLEAVSRSDLYSLAKEVQAAVSVPAAPAPVENSPKLKAPKTGNKKLDKKVAEVLKEDEEAEAEEEPETEVEETPKKPAKGSAKKGEAKKPVEKPKAKPEKPKKPAVETTDGLTTKELPLAKIFPKEIEHEELGKLVACPDKYHSVDEVRNALDEGKTLIFASYWTKRHLKEFAYAQTHGVPVPKNGFPFDLDALQVLYVCEGIDRIYALSTYTEAMFCFTAEDLVPTDCEANDGSKFKMRYSAGLEYEIYEVVE